MAEHTHAEHDPTRSTEETPIHPPTSFGVVYPKDDIIAVIADHAEAERAVQALQDAGIPADDIDLLEGKQLLEIERDLQARQTLAGRVGRLLSFLTSDEGAYQQQYVDEATKGHHILVVHAPESDVVERVQNVLVAHHARHARRYGALTVTDLIS
jgi:hypothetical protein